jgi:hypothetical protein
MTQNAERPGAMTGALSTGSRKVLKLAGPYDFAGCTLAERAAVIVTAGRHVERRRPTR